MFQAKYFLFLHLRSGPGRALLALSVAFLSAIEARADAGGDCYGPPLPPELIGFGSPPTPQVIASADIGHAADARLPLGQSIYLKLTPASVFRSVMPVSFLNRTLDNKLLGGGFAQFDTKHYGRFWIVAHSNEASIGLVELKGASVIEPTHVFTVPCSIGLVLEYALEAGSYRLQFVSSSPAVPLIEVMAAGASSDSLRDLSLEKRIAR